MQPCACNSSRPSAGTLIARLEAIGESLALDGRAEALLAFGSCGAETERLDDCSDLDFLVVAKAGEKGNLHADLSWLARTRPLVFTHAMTEDGYKALFEDGILCDFGIVEEGELGRIPHGQGRVVWAVDPRFGPYGAPNRGELGPLVTRKAAWHRGEALVALYVGLLRFLRGERLAAFRLVQVEALDALLALGWAPNGFDESVAADPFAPVRRVEGQRPGAAAGLSRMVAGYDESPAAALAILEALESLGAFGAQEEAMAGAIRTLATSAENEKRDFTGRKDGSTLSLQCTRVHELGTGRPEAIEERP